MANSNENTQNPKDDQEKIADEGIQKHSEHTAENKQPESKNDVQNTDESTCLCKFFKKIAEWMCPRKNKNSNKADENATENNDAAKQAEIKQADMVEQPKEQVKLTDILETVSKLLGISAVLGIIIGGFVTYIYLDKINNLSIFPDTLSNPSSLIALITPFGFLSLLLSILFFFTYQFGLSLKTKSERVAKGACFFLLFAFTSFYIFIVLDIMIIVCTWVFMLITLFLGLFDILDPKKGISFSIFCSCIIAVLIFWGVLFSNHTNILSFFRFIETNQNSSWYLLHNNFQQNNGSQETNGIDKNDLRKIKEKFNCSSFLKKQEKDNIEPQKRMPCSTTPEQRNNALYGYMAWNLGDTKVFCPRFVDNKTGNENNQITGNCIVISGKALQIMPEGYISTNTDGIDDGNPDNTGHDDPAIDIKTDVRFKNDLNAQSNAGLNNFNVQPILPIQSNAKNMSIQINYGGCNHDSPRNKDGHPDLGYTDKKICQ
ncbi:MFS transporter [Neisseria subflava]|uniref:MFS transporter n=1 Tax=Neisseria subflava TaxID=28449 RepID=A0A9X9N422_NEISU|nr:MFS transporter [Neisseria subflava]UTG72756.1 MFS transporter [Neisseria subflava]